MTTAEVVIEQLLIEEVTVSAVVYLLKVVTAVVEIAITSIINS